ncbi:hypothetical protein [Streptomyces roseoverticillatus]|uniref:hypothetical protein n=1 Tax=Streptomyces roseoverticillatus TaxID=66429 RepID=UPI0005B87CDE|nr:hypothetical protein [Streptomyces roseoverticillatus]
MSSRISLPAFRRRRAAACAIALAGVLALAGCTGGDEDASPAKKPSPSVSAPASAAPSSPSQAPSASPAALPSRSVTPAPVLPKPSRKPATPPAAGHTSAAGSSERTQAPREAGTTCELRSSAGNCYKAGQYCRTADVGASTHDAQGRLMSCGGSGKPRWHY